MTTNFLAVRLWLLALRIAGGYTPIDLVLEAWPHGARGLVEA